LSDLQGRSPIARLYKWNFVYSCAAAHEILAEVVRHVISL